MGDRPSRPAVTDHRDDNLPASGPNQEAVDARDEEPAGAAGAIFPGSVRRPSGKAAELHASAHLRPWRHPAQARASRVRSSDLGEFSLPTSAPPEDSIWRQLSVSAATIASAHYGRRFGRATVQRMHQPVDEVEHSSNDHSPSAEPGNAFHRDGRPGRTRGRWAAIRDGCDHEPFRCPGTAEVPDAAQRRAAQAQMTERMPVMARQRVDARHRCVARRPRRRFSDRTAWEFEDRCG